MDIYPMPATDTLVNAAAGHKVISFMDGALVTSDYMSGLS
jgi:hypothetical protein